MINKNDMIKPLEITEAKSKDRQADVTFFVQGG